MHAIVHTYPPAIPQLSALKRGIAVIQYLKRTVSALSHGNCETTKHDRYATFGHIITEHDRLISQICFSYSHTREEFEDLRQDTYINIWQGLKHFNHRSTIKTWLYRVTLNTCISSIRLKSKRINNVSIDELCYSIADDDQNRQRLLSELHDCINMLNPIDKAIIIMWLDEFSYDEISDVMGLNRNTIASRLKRAKEKLIKL